MEEANQTTAIVTPERKVAEMTKSTQDWITKAITTEEIKCPKGYDYKGEIYLALMMLATEVKDKNGVLAVDACTPANIMTEIKWMVKKGLSMAKKQCYPIVRGGKLKISPSYFGTQAIVERIIPDSKVHANVLRYGDEYEYFYNEETESYELKVTKAYLENINNPIVAVFGCVKVNGEKIKTDVMSWEQILTSWSHAQTDAVQKKHPTDMARRTLVNHMCKDIINVSKDIDSSDAMEYINMVNEENDFSDDSLKNVTPPNDKGMEKFDRLMEENAAKEPPTMAYEPEENEEPTF